MVYITRKVLYAMFLWHARKIKKKTFIWTQILFIKKNLFEKEKYFELHRAYQLCYSFTVQENFQVQLICILQVNECLINLTASMVSHWHE